MHAWGCNSNDARHAKQKGEMDEQGYLDTANTGIVFPVPMVCPTIVPFKDTLDAT